MFKINGSCKTYGMAIRQTDQISGTKYQQYYFGLYIVEKIMKIMLYELSLN